MNERTTRVAIVAWLSIGLAVGAPDSFTPAVEAVPVVPAEDLRYSIVDGQATITGCGGHDCQEGLVIPAAITSGSTTYPVVAIDDNAFEYPDDPDDDPDQVIVGAVVIPDSVLSVGPSAFEGQRNMTALDLGDGVQTIGAEAFSGARGLSSLTLGTSLTTIGDKAFYDGGLLSRVDLPDSVTSVGSQAFRQNAITSLDLGSGLQSIGTYAFANNLIGALVVPDSVTTIGGYAFASAGITSIGFGSSIATIDYGAFGSNQLTSVTLPASVTAVGAGAFSWMPTLTRVDLEGPPPAATGSGNAFNNSNSLTAVHVPYGLGYGSSWGGKPTVVVMRAPSAPTGVTAVTGDGRATVSWVAPATSDAEVTAYVVTASPDGHQCTWTSGPLVCEVTGLSNGTAYTFTVTATSSAGTSVASAVSAVATPTTSTTSTTSTAASTPTTSSAALAAVPAATSTSTIPTTTAPVADQPVSPPSAATIARLPLGDLIGRADLAVMFTVTGDGFTPGEQVLLVVASTPQVIARAVADDVGRVTFTTRLPEALGSGAHTLAVYAPGSGHGVRQPFDLGPGALPATGSGGGVAVALLILAFGGLSAVVSGHTRGRGGSPRLS